MAIAMRRRKSTTINRTPRTATKMGMVAMVRRMSTAVATGRRAILGAV